MINSLDDRPLRILHVLKGMDRGGAETWLMNVLRVIDRERFRFDFLTGTVRPCAYDDELRAMGCGIMPCMGAHRPWAYARNFLKIMNQHGPYDVIHSHVHHYSGFVCWLAQRAGIPVRIAHSHSDTRSKENSSNLFRRGYLRVMENLVTRHAGIGLACSSPAADSLFGQKWQRDARWRVLPCGIDVEAFAGSTLKDAIRGELGLPSDALVVGHVGRFSEVKNHTFLLDVLALAIARNPRVHALLVGDGPLKTRMEEKAAQLGIGNHVIFAGTRADIPRLMAEAMDVFIFPSVLEGLGLAVVEAQAAGLCCVLADTIPTEADVVPGLTQRVSLKEEPKTWAQILLEVAQREPIAAAKALGVVRNSPFSIQRSVKSLEDLYTQGVKASASGSKQ